MLPIGLLWSAASFRNNGVLDAGEASTLTNANGEYSFTNLAPGTYQVREAPRSGWLNLTGDPAPLTIVWDPVSQKISAFAAYAGQANPASDPLAQYRSESIPLDAVTHAPDLAFGNVKLGPGGGRTLGFWSNNNGRAALENGPGGMAGALRDLRDLNLRNADGSPFDPRSYDELRTWLLNANATNMAHMLSAQLAATFLDVRQGFVNGNSLIYAPGTNSADAAGFATVNAVIAEANAELAVHAVTQQGNAWRAYQQKLKDALDHANNNLTFLQGLVFNTSTGRWEAPC